MLKKELKRIFFALLVGAGFLIIFGGMFYFGYHTGGGREMSYLLLTPLFFLAPGIAAIAYLTIRNLS